MIQYGFPKAIMKLKTGWFGYNNFLIRDKGALDKVRR
jgi:hypothetical protein